MSNQSQFNNRANQTIEIPPYLESQIKEGKVVLLLGSGASYEAKDKNERHPPMGGELAKMLSDKFLGGKYQSYPLDQVSELAISESDLFQVQDYIREIFEPFQPTEAHELMTTFRWEGIVTTNYDRLIELAYKRNPKAVQKPQAYIENGDRILDKMRDPNSVMLLKIHGCITRINNCDCPLILSIDQYVDHKHGRSNLFSKLCEWGGQRSIVFIGHSIHDFDLRVLLKELSSDDTMLRPRFYTVTPDADEIQKRLWETKKVTCIQSTFLEFMKTLDNLITSSFRGIHVDYSTKKHSIEERFARKGIKMSERCLQFLDIEVDYVKDCAKSEVIDAKQFYRGFDFGWAAIEQNLDVRRRIADEIISDNIISDIYKDTSAVILLRAEAGAGKSVLLKRIAWDSTYDYNKLCLFLKPQGTLDLVALQELQDLCQERIFLFIDNIANHIYELNQLMRSGITELSHITIIGAERMNEWNMVDESVKNLVSTSYELRYLSEKEIIQLLGLLKSHKALGTLEKLNENEQLNRLKDHAGRQLLVALHEATLGKTFEEIVVNEYRNIPLVEAQSLYLSICIMHRLKVGMRAGIISRIHGINFDQFKDRLFHPLEKIVHTEYNRIIRDYIYTTRHSIIADMVFLNVLVNQEERFDKYIRCFKTLNIDYDADSKAFNQMTKARNLMDLFTNPDLIQNVFSEAQAMAPNNPFLLQQIAIYEMHNPSGNITRAEVLLNKAIEMAPYSTSLKHSLAELQFCLAERALTPLQKEKHLQKAEATANSLTQGRSIESHPYHTICKANLMRLEDALQKTESEFSLSEIEKITLTIERTLSEGLQRIPEDPYLLEAESRLGELLNDSERALSALKRAFESNKRNSWYAIQLSRSLQQKGKLEEAIEILKQALDANSNNHELHYNYAIILLRSQSHDNNELIFHLHRSYSPGDANYKAQLLHGRQLFIAGEIEGSKKIFDKLKQVRMSPENKNRIRYPIENIFFGEISKSDVTYIWIRRDGMGDFIFSHKANNDNIKWEDLNSLNRSRVSFSIGFNMHGPTAFAINAL